MIHEYEDQYSGERVTFNTRHVEYQSIWKGLQLTIAEQEAADRVIELYHKREKFLEGVVIFTADSFMKPYRREEQRHQADHYLSREVIEAAAQDSNLIDKLIQSGILQRHRKWDKFFQEPKEIEGITIMTYSYEKKHPQVPYKLDPNVIRKLENGEPVF